MLMFNRLYSSRHYYFSSYQQLEYAFFNCGIPETPTSNLIYQDKSSVSLHLPQVTSSEGLQSQGVLKNKVAMSSGLIRLVASL